MDSATEELDFTFYLPGINFNSYLWLLGIAVPGKGVNLLLTTYVHSWVHEYVCMSVHTHVRVHMRRHGTSGLWW